MNEPPRFTATHCALAGGVGGFFLGCIISVASSSGVLSERYQAPSGTILVATSVAGMVAGYTAQRLSRITNISTLDDQPTEIWYEPEITIDPLTGAPTSLVPSERVIYAGDRQAQFTNPSDSESTYPPLSSPVPLREEFSEEQPPQSEVITRLIQSRPPQDNWSEHNSPVEPATRSRLEELL